MGMNPLQTYPIGAYAAYPQYPYQTGGIPAAQLWSSPQTSVIADTLQVKGQPPSMLYKFRTPDGFCATVYRIHNSPDPDACPKVMIVDTQTDLKSVRTFFPDAGSIKERPVYK